MQRFLTIRRWQHFRILGPPYSMQEKSNLNLYTATSNYPVLGLTYVYEVCMCPQCTLGDIVCWGWEPGKVAVG